MNLCASSRAPPYHRDPGQGQKEGRVVKHKLEGWFVVREKCEERTSSEFRGDEDEK